MNFDISQKFFFDAAHTLGREIEADSSRRIHGHTYHAEVTLTGQPDPLSGMVQDLGLVRLAIDSLRPRLDHHMLDDVVDLGPATLENLCAGPHDRVEVTACLQSRQSEDPQHEHQKRQMDTPYGRVHRHDRAL